MSADHATMLREVGLTERQLHRIFAATPHPYLVLTPEFLIVGANDTYLTQTLTCRADIVGRHMFDVFPDNPDTPESRGVQHLQHSLRMVLDLRLPHHMVLQRYDVRDPHGRFVERHWRPINYPVLDDRKRVSHLLHHVENVTDAVLGRNTRLQITRLNYLERAKYCAEQASACDSREMRLVWTDMQEQYLKLAAGSFGA